ncbi:MAG: hypothetical protein GX868_15750 [Actinobacteria bacterium]|nr:hypothetical protein [Actinomycetota bacterium]
MSILAALDNTGYDIQLVVHILSVAVWAGSTVALTLAANSAVKNSSEVIGWFAGLSKVLNLRVKSVAFVLLFVTGMGLLGMSEKYFKISDPFISVGFAAVIIGGAVGGMLHAPAAKAMAAAAASGNASDAKQAASKMMLGNAIETVLVVVTVFMMVSAR